jgi:uncharacterized protein YndB with AHSA1/START domain
MTASPPEKESATSTEPIVVEQTFDAPIEKVWEAVTDADQMRQWFFEPIETFEPRIGFQTRFTVEADGREYLHLWKITEVKPPHKIVYNWRYGGHPGDSFVTWELSDEGEGTKLTVTHDGTHTFPRDDPAFTRESGQNGWEYFIQQRLKAFVETAPSH